MNLINSFLYYSMNNNNQRYKELSDNEQSIEIDEKKLVTISDSAQSSDDKDISKDNKESKITDKKEKVHLDTKKDMMFSDKDIKNLLPDTRLRFIGPNYNIQLNSLKDLEKQESRKKSNNNINTNNNINNSNRNTDEITKKIYEDIDKHFSDYTDKYLYNSIKKYKNNKMKQKHVALFLKLKYFQDFFKKIKSSVLNLPEYESLIIEKYILHRYFRILEEYNQIVEKYPDIHKKPKNTIKKYISNALNKKSEDDCNCINYFLCLHRKEEDCSTICYNCILTSCCISLWVCISISSLVGFVTILRFFNTHTKSQNSTRSNNTNNSKHNRMLFNIIENNNIEEYNKKSIITDNTIIEYNQESIIDKVIIDNEEYVNINGELFSMKEYTDLFKPSISNNHDNLELKTKKDDFNEHKIRKEIKKQNKKIKEQQNNKEEHFKTKHSRTYNPFEFLKSQK